MTIARMTPEDEEEFAAFWRKFPLKTQKIYAKECFLKARAHATAEEIIAGIDNYLQAKHPDANFCHPSTFLNQGRWMDEPDTSLAVPQKAVGSQNMRLLGIVNKLAG